MFYSHFILLPKFFNVGGGFVKNKISFHVCKDIAMSAGVERGGGCLLLNLLAGDLERLELPCIVFYGLVVVKNNCENL